VSVALACMVGRRIEVSLDGRIPGQARCESWSRFQGVWINTDWKCRHAESVNLTKVMPVDQAVGFLQRRSDLIDPESASLVLMTSGTTSQAKGVTLSHQNLLGNAAAKLACVPQSTDDVRLTSLPLSHAYARTCDLGTWLLSGSTLAIGLGWEAWTSLAPAVRPTLANVVPSLADRLMECADDGIPGEKLRLLGCGGAALSAKAFARWQRRGVIVIQGYGLTEASPVIASATPANASPGLVGTPVQEWETKIVDGVLYARGPHTMLGYWNDPDATARVVDSEGWLCTGDNVEWDEATGQLRLLGRADEVVVFSNGRKLHPSTLERALAGITGVRHAMVDADSKRRNPIVWLDTDPDVSLGGARPRIEELLQVHVPWLTSIPEIRRFDPSLSFESGELTAKGTPRRNVIRQRRMT
ncbi:MAG: AMP-binding protein, partial [Planctomycetota bacterium]